MAVALSWIILGLFAAGAIFGIPYLLSGGYDYWKSLGLWIALLVASAIVVSLLLFAVGVVFVA